MCFPKKEKGRKRRSLRIGKSIRDENLEECFGGGDNDNNNVDRTRTDTDG